MGFLSAARTSAIAWAVAAVGLWAQAPPPATLTLVPRYTAGSSLYYAVTIHSAAGMQATLDTTAEVVMRILPGATPGHFDTEMHFTKYATTVQADESLRPALAGQAAATDKAALGMTPARFRVGVGTFQVLARPTGSEYDQPVEMLEELVRTDALPPAGTPVGGQWTHQRTRDLPTLNFSVPLNLACQLTAVGQSQGQPAATISVHAQGNTALPPNALPDSDALAAQGLVAEASLRFDITATSQYRVADAVLLASSSSSDNHLHIKLVGPSPKAGEQDSDFSSTATVKLERVQP